MKHDIYTHWLKRLFHLNRPLATQQVHAANRIGANAFTYLYFYLLGSSLLFIGLASWVTRNQLFQIIILTNFIVAFIVIGTLYVKESLVILGLRRPTATSTKDLLIITGKRATTQAIFFWIVLVFLDQLTRNVPFFHAIRSLRSLFGALFFGIIFTLVALVTDWHRHDRP